MKNRSFRIIPGLAAALLTGLLWPGSSSAAVVEIYNTQTNFNWVCPPGVTSLKVECWGGGGGGGSSLVDTNFTLANAGGGGGGGGAYAARFNVPVTPGNSYNITIPAVATPTTSGFTNNQRFNGSAVSFTGDGGINVTANGGAGGQCKITTGTALTGQVGNGGAAGVGYDAAWPGGTSANWSAGNGSGGGGGAGDLGAGGGATAASGSFGAGGTGSDAAHTGGDGGAARNGVGAGNVGLTPGGGGGGAKSTTTSTGVRKGGNGGSGQIILTYTLPALTPVVKDNNSTNLNVGASWVGGVVPDALGVATWNSTVTSANTTVLGGDLNWGGITIVDPAGLVTINAGNTLTLSGFAITNIDMSAATADLTLNCGLALGNANVWDVQAGRTLTVGGAVSGTNDITTQNAGTVVLSSGANDYVGTTTVGATSTLKLGAANVIPNGSGKGNIAVSGTLDLNAISTTLNGLSGAGTVDTVAGGTPTLALGAGDSSGTFTGVIQNTAGTLSLTKTGTNRHDLVGANTFSGAVAVNQGWLTVGASNSPLANVSSITVADGATFGAYDTEVDVNTPITLGAGNPTINITAGFQPQNSGANTQQRPFRLNGGITGTGNVVFKGVNRFNWMGTINVSNCTYTGSTLITCVDLGAASETNNANIVVRLLGENALPTTTVVTMDGEYGDANASGVGRFCDLNLAGWSQTLAGLTNVPGRNKRVQRVVNSGSAAPATLTINNSTDYEFSGWMGATSSGSSPGDNLDLVKSGSGTFILSKTDGNTYTLGTTVNGGTLLVNNETGSGTGTGDVNVNSGGTLGGTGGIAGNVSVNAGGTLAPGASIGALAVNGALVLDALSTNIFEVNGSSPANDEVVLGSSVTYGGVLKIVPTGSFTVGQTFTLFSGPGAEDASNFASIQSPSGVFSFTNGVLTVVTAPVTGPSGPATLTNSFNGTTLSLSWPGGQGWRLEQQTNALSKGISTNWVDVTPGSASSTNITVDATKPTVFYRLAYP